MKRAMCLMFAALIAPGIFAEPAAAQPAPPPHSVVPPVPATLEVPAGHELYLAGYAEGTQNYICLPAAGGGTAWRFLGPQATLFYMFKGGVWQQVMTHFLSVNPDEGLMRPTWQHSFDSSRVWGRVIASSSDPNFVEGGAIPWLLLAAAGLDTGTTRSVLAEATYIQRLNTSGGVAPSAGCSDASEIGTLALVPYATDYFFYRAANPR
jgi:hypothetical protein